MARGESQQPELLVDFIVSLDGYAAADDWPGLWGLGGPGYFEEVRSMKESGYVSMSTVGSLSLCRSLPKAGLVDRLRGWSSSP